MANCIINRTQDLSTIKTNISSLQTSVSNLQTNKQDKLVSGTNIKTINSTSLLGSGNILLTRSDPLSSPDLNKVTFNFQGYVTSSTNGPAGANANGHLFVTSNSAGGYVYQFYTPYNSVYFSYSRHLNGSWTEWVRNDYLAYGGQVYENGSNNIHIITGDAGTTTLERHDWSIEKTGRITFRSATRTSVSAAWSEWSGWTDLFIWPNTTYIHNNWIIAAGAFGSNTNYLYFSIPVGKFNIKNVKNVSIDTDNSTSMNVIIRGPDGVVLPKTDLIPLLKNGTIEENNSCVTSGGVINIGLKNVNSIPNIGTRSPQTACTVEVQSGVRFKFGSN